MLKKKKCADPTVKQSQMIKKKSPVSGECLKPGHLGRVISPPEGWRGLRGAGGTPRFCPLHTAHFGGQGGEPTPRRTGPAQHWETLLVSGRGSSPTPDRALREAFHSVTRAERCYRCDHVQSQWPGTFWGWAPLPAHSRLHF